MMLLKCCTHYASKFAKLSHGHRTGKGQFYYQASQVVLVVKNLPANAGDVRAAVFDPWVGKDPLQEGMATHSSILAWRIPWTEEHGGSQFIGSQRVGHD